MPQGSPPRYCKGSGVHKKQEGGRTVDRRQQPRRVSAPRPATAKFGWGGSSHTRRCSNTRRGSGHRHRRAPPAPASVSCCFASCVASASVNRLPPAGGPLLTPLAPSQLRAPRRCDTGHTLASWPAQPGAQRSGVRRLASRRGLILCMYALSAPSHIHSSEIAVSTTACWTTCQCHSDSPALNLHYRMSSMDTSAAPQLPVQRTVLQRKPATAAPDTTPPPQPSSSTSEAPSDQLSKVRMRLEPVLQQQPTPRVRGRGPRSSCISLLRSRFAAGREARRRCPLPPGCLQLAAVPPNSGGAAERQRQRRRRFSGGGGVGRAGVGQDCISQPLAGPGERPCSHQAPGGWHRHEHSASAAATAGAAATAAQPRGGEARHSRRGAAP